MSTNSINLNLKFWLAGVITGVVLIERWRRHGDRSLSMTEPLRGAVDSTTGKPKASKAIVAGAKADARRLLEQVKSTPTPSGTVEASSSPATSG